MRLIYVGSLFVRNEAEQRKLNNKWKTKKDVKHYKKQSIRDRVSNNIKKYQSFESDAITSNGGDSPS